MRTKYFRIKANYQEIHYFAIVKNILSKVGFLLMLQYTLFVTALQCQEAGPPIFFDHLTIREGLSHNTVHSLLQDQYGYVWIGTQNGLNKYDGYNFEVYRSGEQSDLNFRGKTITALYEDRAGNLWVGTAKGQINFKKDGEEVYENWAAQFPDLKFSQITAFFEDSKGLIWIATRFSGVICFDPKNNAIKIYDKESGNFPSQNEVFDVTEDSDGKIWLANVGIGLSYLNEKEVFVPSHVFEEGKLNIEGYRKKLLVDGDYLWIATEGTGLYYLNTKTLDFERYSPDNQQFKVSSGNVRGIIRTDDDRIFAPSDGGGLNEINLKTGTTKIHWSSYEKPARLNSNALISIMQDRTGNVWIGSFNGGVNLIKKHKNWFEWHTQGKGGAGQLVQGSILSILETSDGKVLMGTDGGGLSWLKNDGEKKVFQTYMNDVRYPQTISGNIVKSIFEDSKKRIWLGCFSSGLDLFDIEKEVFRSYSLGNNIIWDILELPNGELLIGTLGDGLLVFNPEMGESRPYSQTFKEQQINSIHIDKKDRLWIGTDYNGLFLKQADNDDLINFKKGDAPNSLADNDIRQIYEDHSGVIWIGTEGGGLSKFLENIDSPFQNLSKNDGLVANSVMGISEDKNQNLWISTYEGISKINPSTGAIENFNFRTGENINQFNQDAILTDKMGRLYFGGINGLHIIHPEEVKKTINESKIIFTGLKIYDKKITSGKSQNGRTYFEKPIQITEEINLNYTDNSFSIDFAQMDFTAPEQAVFEYKMEGFDENWQFGQPGEHSAHYTNLDAGSFNFRVRNGNSEASVVVNIKPPFWNTTWFRIFMLLMISALVIGGFLFVLNRQQEAYKQQMIKAESEILQLKNEKLEAEVQVKNSKLMFSSVQMAHKKEILSNIKEEMAETKDDPKKLRQVLRMLDKELEGEDYWKEFNLYFDQVDKQFLKSIKKQHPKLTQNDIRLCSLIRLNLSTKEIASLLNVSVRGVEQSRYRLKKRLDLEGGRNLVEYISEFE